MCRFYSKLHIGWHSAIAIGSDRCRQDQIGAGPRCGSERQNEEWLHGTDRGGKLSGYNRGRANPAGSWCERARGTTDTSVPLPLFLAAGTGEVEKAELLIAHGDGVNEKWTRRGGSYSPLINAIDMGDAPMVQFLLDSGADIRERDLRGLTPLSRAVLSNYKDVVAVLIAKGADVNAPDGIGLTPLHYAAMADYGDTAIVQQLLAAGAKRDAKDSQGYTPMQRAEQFHYMLLASALR